MKNFNKDKTSGMFQTLKKDTEFESTYQKTKAQYDLSVANVKKIPGFVKCADRILAKELKKAEEVPLEINKEVIKK